MHTLASRTSRWRERVRNEGDSPGCATSCAAAATSRSSFSSALRACLIYAQPQTSPCVHFGLGIATVAHSSWLVAHSSSAVIVPVRAYNIPGESRGEAEAEAAPGGGGMREELLIDRRPYKYAIRTTSTSNEYALVLLEYMYCTVVCAHSPLRLVPLEVED